MPLIDQSSFARAIKNVAERGDTDIFPFPFENHVFYDRPAEMQSVLTNISDDFETVVNTQAFVSHSSLAPAGYNGFRWATQIDPLWNAYLLSLVLQLAGGIEGVRVGENTVFSYRYRAESDNGLFEPDGWRRFQERSRELAEESGYVVCVDIADFYARIYHHRLQNALYEIDKGRNITRQIMAILTKLSNNTSYGLPVGGPAARILAELLLNPIDRLVGAERTTTRYVRYADDYRFFVNSLPAAYRAIGYLSEKLQRNQGLALQKAKTRIFTSAEFLSTLDPIELPAGSAARFLSLHVHFDPYSATAEEDYDRLKGQLEEFDIVALLRRELQKGQIHAALTRRLVAVLHLIDPELRWQALVSLLDNVDTLVPILPQVIMAIRNCLDGLTDEQVEQIHDSVRTLITERHHTAEIELNLAYMVRLLATRHGAANEQLLADLYRTSHTYDGEVPPNLKRDIMLIMARWRVRWWLSDTRNYISDAHPWVRRAFIVASFSLDDEGAHWRNANKSSFNWMEREVRDWSAANFSQPGWRIPV